MEYLCSYMNIEISLLRQVILCNKIVTFQILLNYSD